MRPGGCLLERFGCQACYVKHTIDEFLLPTVILATLGAFAAAAASAAGVLLAAAWMFYLLVFNHLANFALTSALNVAVQVLSDPLVLC